MAIDRELLFAPFVNTSGPWEAFEVNDAASMISPFFRSVALASADIAAPAGTGVARTELDGSWSVPIITNSGPATA